MPRLTVWMVRTALLYLGMGFTFGALMLWNKGVPSNPAVWKLLFPHVEFVLVGWTAQLAMGVAFWILPRLPGAARFGNVRLAWAAFVIFNVGVLGAALGYWLNAAALIALGRAVEAVGVALFAACLWSRVRPLMVGSQT